MSVKIFIGTTYIAVDVTETGYLKAASTFSIASFLKRHLTQFTYLHHMRRWVITNRYVFYDKPNKRLRMPRHYLPVLTRELDDLNIEYTTGTIGSYTPRSIEIPLNKTWKDRDERQTSGIKFLMKSDMPMRALAAQTGCVAEHMMVDVYINNCFSKKILLCEAYSLYNAGHSIQVLLRRNNGYHYWPIVDITHSGQQETYRLVLENRQWVTLTPDHRVETEYGFVKLLDLKLGTPVIGKFTGGSCPVKSIEYAGINETYDITCHDPNHSFLANNISVHNSGKTYMAIKTAAQLGYPTIIFVSGLLEQWKNAILEQTEIDEDDIFLIQGHKSIGTLCSDKYDPYHSFYLASTDTIQRWIDNYTKNRYKRYLTLNQLLYKLKVGTKIIDECHLNFRTNVKIDLQTRVINNIYLSATYSQSDKKKKKIFDTVYPPSIKHGENDIRKYSKVTAYKYNLGYINPNAVRTTHGYSQFKYEKYLLKRKTKLQAYLEIINSLIYSHYLNIKKDGQRLLIFCGLVKMCNVVNDHLKKICDEYGLSSVVYVSDTPEEELDKNDIIISTVGSLGVGNDLVKLRSVLLTTAFDSNSFNKQTLGRLRELKEEDGTPEFVYIVNSAIEAHMRYHDSRSYLFSKLAASYQSFDI